MKTQSNSPGCRAFIALKPPRDWQRELARLQRVLRARAGAGCDSSLSWVTPPKAHITLFFLGEIATSSVPVLAAALQQAASRIVPFEIGWAICGVFPAGGRPRVLWCGIEPWDTLLALHREIGAALLALDAVLLPTLARREIETAPFHPHLTLARVRAAQGINSVQSPRHWREIVTTLRNEDAHPLLWRVEKVFLVQSQLRPQGAEYSHLAQARLGS